MTEPEFDYLRAYLKERSGLALGPEKRYLVESRLGPVCRSFGLASIGLLVAALKGARGLSTERATERAIERAVVEAMTTNETFFFRDRTPFDLFREVLLPRALSARASTRRLRIWCAAASSGQEPYSLAILLQEAAPLMAGWSVEIVATDLSTEVLERGRNGLYSHFEVQRGLPAQLLVKHFAKVGEQWRINPALTAMVDFRSLNLLQPFEHLGTFDIVFCRNVLIYFDLPTKSDVLTRIGRALAPEGAVLLGAAETVIGLTDALVPDGTHRGLYRRGPRPSAPALMPAPTAAVSPASSPAPLPALGSAQPRRFAVGG